MNKIELQMVLHPDKGLREKAVGMSENDVLGDNRDLVRQTAGAMIRLMYTYTGIGLAAQQVGFPGAMFVLDTQWPKSGRYKPQIFVNPIVLEHSDEAIEVGGRGEGCLSTPYGFYANVKRAAQIKIKWRDLNWYEHEEWFDDMDAIAIQHEIDHLHGHLFIDHLSRLKQDIFNRKVKKMHRLYRKGQQAAMREIQNV